MKVQIPASVAMLAGKMSVESAVDKKYKPLEKPLHDILQSLHNIKDGYIDKIYKEADEAWKNMHKGDEPVLSAYYFSDFIRNLQNEIKRLRNALDDYDSSHQEIE